MLDNVHLHIIYIIYINDMLLCLKLLPTQYLENSQVHSSLLVSFWAMYCCNDNCLIWFSISSS